MTETHALELDFASKWAESIGQSLYYALITDKKPGVVLIMEDEERDKKYLKRLHKVADKYGIDIWVVNQQNLLDKSIDIKKLPSKLSGGEDAIR